MRTTLALIAAGGQLLNAPIASFLKDLSGSIWSGFGAFNLEWVLERTIGSPFVNRSHPSISDRNIFTGVHSDHPTLRNEDHTANIVSIRLQSRPAQTSSVSASKTTRRTKKSLQVK